MKKPVAPGRISALAVAADTITEALVADKRPRGRPRKTADERDEGNRRVGLLHAAARLFREKGFAATSTRDIAAAVGMRSGSPFYHFESKGALLYAVMEQGMQAALRRQAAALQVAESSAPDASALLRVLIRNHFEVLLGPGSDFVPVTLYESRSLTAQQRGALASLRSDYEGVWVPVLEALSATGRLKGPVKLARLLILGALNWAVQWFDANKPATLDDLTDAAMALFVQEPSSP
ncbi:transcriptional regulator, TetR family [Polaromonas sp. OV174]|uniref:TetR/AcrR family transcriptional regulator n=1 Tax=Polaromonas sp. OV174 TaxID=1855300 RepID=UPI0008F3DFC5|nr:TetR/AcrR family transcriptional regulator [Polaromonas sp. OV174]SFB66916.1 transcriptional regulator, TetR family [Polaromonas sp. OV174]